LVDPVLHLWLKGQSKMDNPEKLATQCIQGELLNIHFDSSQVRCTFKFIDGNSHAKSNVLEKLEAFLQ
jgi:hypothetical protein